VVPQWWIQDKGAVPAELLLYPESTTVAPLNQISHISEG